MIKISQLINDNNNPAANQIIIEVNKGVIFQSYDSVIAFYNKNDGKVYVTKDWDYSSTTRKHFLSFFVTIVMLAVIFVKRILNMSSSKEIMNSFPILIWNI